MFIFISLNRYFAHQACELLIHFCSRTHTYTTTTSMRECVCTLLNIIYQCDYKFFFSSSFWKKLSHPWVGIFFSMLVCMSLCKPMREWSLFEASNAATATSNTPLPQPHPQQPLTKSKFVLSIEEKTKTEKKKKKMMMKKEIERKNLDFLFNFFQCCSFCSLPLCVLILKFVLFH